MSGESEMVVRVAMAIAKAELRTEWVNWRPFEEHARAAIAAIRTPTEAMMRELQHVGMLDGDCECAWEAAIDAALSPSS